MLVNLLSELAAFIFGTLELLDQLGYSLSQVVVLVQDFTRCCPR